MNPVQAALRRRDGMSENAQRAMERALDAREWRATCRVCGEKLVGTVAALKAHVHTEGTSDVKS
jgi:hypothetical protein